MSVIAFDIETTRKTERSSPYTDEILLISMFDGKKITQSRDIEDFEEILADPDVLKIFQNGSFDIQFLEMNSFSLDIENVWDTMLAERLLTSGTGQRCDLATIVDKYCDEELDKSVRSTFSRHQGSLTGRQLRYAADDVRYLIAVYNQQSEEISLRGMDHVMWLENSLVPIVSDMELDGIGFDPKAWYEILEEEQEIIPRVEGELQQLLSKTFRLDLFGGMVGTVNLNSHTQLKAAFSRLGVNLSNTNVETLKECTHPAAKLVLEYRKHRDRAKWDYPQYVNPITHRIHPNYNQLGAKTGRFSCSKPNLQQVPKDPKFRRMFVPKMGYTLVTADYSQQELRILAELCGDPAFRLACASSDIHATTAREAYNDQTITKGDDRRSLAKNSNFAMIYGAGAKRLAASLGIPVKEARDYFKKMGKAYPGISRWGHQSWVGLKETGYITTIAGRRRYFPGVRSNPGKYMTMAKNSPIQGSAADMMKLAMLYTVQDLSPYDARLILSVHDEQVIEVVESQAEEVMDIVVEAMVRAGEYYVKSVPIIAEAVIADTWTK